METKNEAFMGVQAPVVVRGVEYQLDFEQQLYGLTERSKSWTLVCLQCQAAAGTKKVPWQSSRFVTGDFKDCPLDEQRSQYASALEEVKEHIALHERMAAWYERLGS